MKTSSPVRATPHLGYLDSLRALAAIYVVIHHAIIYIWPPWSAPAHSMVVRAAIDFFYFGRCAVAVFIVLSGYCLALPVFGGDGSIRGGVVGFLRRRARRLLPPYYAALILSILFIALTGTARTETLWDDSTRWSWAGLAAHLAVVQDFFGRWSFGQFNYVLWSVAVEWHIYFFFPLLLLLWRTKRPALAVGLAVTGISVVAWPLRTTDLTHLNVQFLGLFALGMLACWLVQKRRPASAKISTVAAMLLGGGAVATILLTFREGWSTYVDRHPISDVATGLATASALVALGVSSQRGIKRLLETRALVSVGHFSYSLYLVHAIAIHSVWLVAARVLHFSFFPMAAMVGLLSLPTSLALAWGFHLCFERPFLNSPPAKAGLPTVPAERVN